MPLWLNRTSGQGARNGTTSHTVTFTASTSGNFLVAVIGGAVTHTATGWTKGASAVGSTEVCVLRKTSAGDSSMTITHNSSNYPIHYIVYEFPSGSTYVSGAQSAGSTTGPTLSSLTGTNTIFGAISNNLATSASGVWTTPTTEDYDSNTPSGATDPTWLGVAYQDGFTGTSYTVTCTVSGRGIGNDERIAFALNVPGGGGPAFVAAPPRVISQQAVQRAAVW